jgi:hypothetical protein
MAFVKNEVVEAGEREREREERYTRDARDVNKLPRNEMASEQLGSNGDDSVWRHTEFPQLLFWPYPSVFKVMKHWLCDTFELHVAGTKLHWSKNNAIQQLE